MSTPEERLVAFATDIQTQSLCAALVENALHHLLDAVSLAQLAREHPVVRAVEELSGNCGGATAWTNGRKMPPLDAALLNGVATHAFFQDDTDMSTWGHPASVVVPAVVASAEHTGTADLRLVLTGLVSGYAAMSWLAAREELSHALVKRGFRASPTLGAIAAAVGASTVLRLSPQQTLSAIGIAADSCGGTLEPVRAGAQDWRLQNGFAAQRGLAAALLASNGVRGPDNPLSGPRGYLAAFTSSTAIPAQWYEDPSTEAILDVWFKPFPILGDNMAAALAACTLAHKLPAVEEVDSIIVGLNSDFASYPGTQYAGPFETVEQAMASTAFGVAAALLRGQITHAELPALLTDPNVQRLISVTTVESRADFGYLDGTVRVVSSAGELSARCQDAPRSSLFRDRAATIEVLTERGQGNLARNATTIYGAIAGGDWPPLADILLTARPGNDERRTP